MIPNRVVQLTWPKLQLLEVGTLSCGSCAFYGMRYAESVSPAVGFDPAGHLDGCVFIIALSRA